MLTTTFVSPKRDTMVSLNCSIELNGLEFWYLWSLCTRRADFAQIDEKSRSKGLIYTEALCWKEVLYTTS